MSIDEVGLENRGVAEAYEQACRQIGHLSIQRNMLAETVNELQHLNTQLAEANMKLAAEGRAKDERIDLLEQELWGADDEPTPVPANAVT